MDLRLSGAINCSLPPEKEEKRSVEINWNVKKRVIILDIVAAFPVARVLSCFLDITFHKLTGLPAAKEVNRLDNGPAELFDGNLGGGPNWYNQPHRIGCMTYIWGHFKTVKRVTLHDSYFSRRFRLNPATH